MNSAATSRPREGVPRPSSASEARKERFARRFAAVIFSIAACSGAAARTVAAHARQKNLRMKQRLRGLLRLVEQKSNITAAAEETHPALLPEFCQLHRSSLSAGGDAPALTGIANLFHRLHHYGMLKFTGNAHGNREVGRPDHHRINTGNRQDFFASFYRTPAFDLQNRKGVVIHVLDDFPERCRLIIGLRRHQTVTADTRGRELRPAKRCFEQLRILHPRKNDPLSTAVERSRNERILQVRDAHYRA